MFRTVFALPFALATITSLDGWAQGEEDASQTGGREVPLESFKPMSPEQAAELAIRKINFGAQAVSGLSRLNKDECDGPKVSVAGNPATGEPAKQVAVCLLDPEELKKMTEEGKIAISGSGLKVSQKKEPKFSLSFSTGNDASPQLVARAASGKDIPNEKKSDDVGLTFDLRGAARRTTEEGYTEVRGGSENFGRRVEVAGNKKDADGRPYYELLNVISLAVEDGKVLKSVDGVKDLRVIEGSVEIAKGRGKTTLGTELQTWFHDATKSGPIYSYVDHEKTKIVVTLKGGLTRILEGDLGKFRCSVTGTGLVGIGSDGKPLIEGRANASINTGSLGGRTSDNPWVQLDLYRQHLIKQGDRPLETLGAKLSTSVQIGGVNIKPFIAVSKNDGSRHRRYGAGSRGGQEETFYTFGIASEW